MKQSRLDCKDIYFYYVEEHTQGILEDNWRGQNYGAITKSSLDVCLWYIKKKSGVMEKCSRFKLMRLGLTNRIVDDSDSKAVDFDRLLTSIRISTI